MLEKINKLLHTLIATAKGFFNMDNIVLIVLVGLALIWSVNSISSLNRNYVLQQRADQANLDNQILQLQNQNLKLQQSYYKTNEFLGLRARSLLGKANPGEHLVLLPTPTQDNLSTRSSLGIGSTVKRTTKSNPEQWREFLFGAK